MTTNSETLYSARRAVAEDAEGGEGRGPEEHGDGQQRTSGAVRGNDGGGGGHGELVTAIRVVAEGGSLFAPSVARRGDRRGPLQAVVLAYESGLVRPAG